MHPAVALSVAAVCFVGAALCYRGRDAVLLWMIRLRGFHRIDPGARRRYQRSRAATRDMALPIVLCVMLGTAFLVRGLLALAALR